MTRAASPLIRVLAPALLLALPAMPASAQLIAGRGDPLSNVKPTVGTAPAQGPRQSAPPALPGARAEPTAVAPADRAAADMEPTEALFDAINRGDLATVRDALSRGADLNGRNVLGLTPLDLAIDLGRNQISFLLLSLRGANPSASPPPASAQAGRTPTRAERAAEAREAQRLQREQRRLAAAAPAAAGVPQAPKLFAGNGGAPVPRAGFLGFDSVR